MKKLLTAMLVFALLCGLCTAGLAGSISESIQALGLSVETSDNAAGKSCCDYTIVNSASAMMEWTDAQHIYTVSGDPSGIAQAYVDALATGNWDVCRYIVGNKARLSYGAKSAKRFDSQEDFAAEVQSVLGVSPSSADQADMESQARAYNYVLNTNTLKFHTPDCTSVKTIKPKNRQDYTGTRDDIISRGYKPCKRCNP